mgnify:CR=1 FL=1
MPNRIPTPGISTPAVRKSSGAIPPAKPMPTPTSTKQIKYATDSYESGWKTGTYKGQDYSYNAKGKIVKGIKGLPKAGGE